MSLAALHRGLCRYWLPFGFFLFVAGLFLAPSTHNFKVIINLMLLLPGLFAALALPRWWPHARPHARLLGALVLYLLYMCTNAWLQNGVEGREFFQWSFYVVVFLIAVGLSMQIGRVGLAQILWLAMIAAAGAALYAIGRDWLTGQMASPGYRLAGYGALYNPLRSGHAFGVLLIVAAWCALAAPLARTQRWLAAASALAIAVAILLTGSRSPLFALALVAALAIARCPLRRHRAMYGVVLLLVAAAIALMFGQGLTERGMSLRPQLWAQTLTLLAAHPWFGVGLGGGILLSADGAHFYDPHNVFLAAAYYGGAIGLLLFGAVFAQGFWSAWSRRQQSPQFLLAALLQVFGIATLQFDGGSLIGRPTEFWLLYWLPIALMLHAARMESPLSHG